MTVDFNDYFWGDKNNGYEVLYQNMKSGLVASKELSDYFRERSNLEEHNSKVLSKLAHKAGTGCPNGTFSPLWVIIKSSAERLSELHLQMMQKVSELVKNIAKYADDLHKKHKTVKEEESHTQDAVQAMKESSVALQKAKDLYQAKLNETEKLKREGASAKEIEKADIKMKKTHDDYKALIDKHNPIKNEFERRMTATCKRFQEMEENHLIQMKEFLTCYIEIVQSNHELVGQINVDFKRQFLEMTVDKLLEQFVLNKYTGLEKPETIEFDLVNLSNNANTQEDVATNMSTMNSQSIGSPTLSNLSHLSQPPKKESNLRSWFNFSQSSNVTAASSSGSASHITERNQTINVAVEPMSGYLETNTSTIEVTGSSPTQSMNIKENNSKTNFGEIFLKQKLKEQLAVNSSVMQSGINDECGAQQSSMSIKSIETKEQQKSSRRTTSLLNLFMSNSQGGRSKHDNHRDLSIPSGIGIIKNITPISSNTCETISAKSSPSDIQHLQDSSQIGRNPLLRGSKFSGFLRSRREKARSKKNKKTKKDSEASSIKDEKLSDSEIKNGPNANSNNDIEASSKAAIKLSTTNLPSLAAAEVDEDGYSIKPGESSWQEFSEPQVKTKTYSSSDSDSDDEPERKIHVEIKPLNNGAAPISASVDELRATVENMSLSPIGVLSGGGGGGLSNKNDLTIIRSKSVSHHLSDNMFKHSVDLSAHTVFQQQQQQHSPIPSNASTPTTGHPYAPLQSPTLSMLNNSTSRYAELGDIFSEVGEMSASAPASANLGRLNHRSTPTSANSMTSSIAIPRPPSRRSEAAVRGRISPASISRADSVGSLEFRTASILGSSRGPSPLTIGLNDTIPLAVAFHEIIHAYFRGSDESRCQVKMSGDLMVSFPAGIVSILANNPNPAKLVFRLKNTSNIDSILPNKQIISIEKMQVNNLNANIEFNMQALTALLRRQSEQNPNASYFNVDILKYQIKPKLGAASCPFQLVSYWKCEKIHTDLKIDYKYNSHAMASASPLLNVSVSVPVDGGVRNVQSKPHSAWMGESNRLVWNFTDISQHSDNNGIDTLRARCELTSGPSMPALLNTQFNCEGTTLSGIEFELVGPGYRVSLVKRRFISGKYICEGDGVRSVKSPATVTSTTNSPSPSSRLS